METHKTGKVRTVLARVSLLLLFLALSGVPANGEDQIPARDPTGAARTVVYQVYEKHMIILGEVVTAGTDKRTFDEAKRKEIRNELAGIDTSLFPGEEKTDFDEWRGSLVAFLDKLPNPAFNRGFQSWEPQRKCMAVLANYDITGAMAKEDGYPQLAEKIDALHDMAKGILLVLCGQDTKALQEVSPVTRAFVEYFYIFTSLARSKNRDPAAQSALLSMKPGEIEEAAARAVFLDLHKSLLSLSHGKNGNSKPFSKGAGIQGKLPLVFLCDLVKKSSIQDAEIEKAKADEKLLGIVKQLREIGKDDRCGRILP